MHSKKKIQESCSEVKEKTKSYESMVGVIKINDHESHFLKVTRTHSFTNQDSSHTCL